ncbi:MAG: glycerol-3-phosphate 1-O-acyltransferase PlsY [Firmicutes bacterium]|nr:glycerol-3-phosphate 1-O-acyltransferase PlsY [Bacillota bacterium]
MVLSLIVSYLIGAIPFGYVVGRLHRGIDVRKHGSGNIGATNVLRVMGPLPAFLVLLGDFAKGAIATLWGFKVGGPPMAAVCGVAAVLGGHWSVFLRFGGGKGIAVSTGAATVLMPRAVLILAAIWAIIVALTRYVSLGSVTIAVLFPFIAWGLGGPREYLPASILIALLVIYKHRSNIRRLIAGKEYKLGQKVDSAPSRNTSGNNSGREKK